MKRTVSNVIIFIFCGVNMDALAQVTLDSEVQSIGKDFYSYASKQAQSWMEGSWAVPEAPFVDVSATINGWILNMRPMQRELPQSVLDGAQFGALEQIYNSTIAMHGQSRCQLIENEICHDLNIKLLGLAVAFRRKENMLLPSGGVEAKKLKMAVLDLIHFSLPRDELNIIVQLMRFESEKDPTALHNFIWTCSKKYEMYDNDYKIDISKLPTDHGLRRGVLINNFRWNIDFLSRALNQRSSLDLYQPINIAVKRLEELRKVVEPYISRSSEANSRDFLVPTEMYGSLGILAKYYESESNIPAVNALIVQRGWLRANFSELTPSCLERFFLKIWGVLTDFGTILGRPTALMFCLIMAALLFVWCELGSGATFLNATQESLKLMTMKGGSNLTNQLWVVMFEFIFMVTIPLYFGYFVTFLLSWR